MCRSQHLRPSYLFLWSATGAVDLVKRAEVSFEQHISNKLHKPLVIRSKNSVAAKPPVPTHSLKAEIPKYIELSTELSVPSAYPPACLETNIVTGDDWTLVIGTKHKDAILADYEAKYETNKDHVVTKLKGKRCIEMMSMCQSGCDCPSTSVVGSEN